jgi:hypothetical protein
VFRQLTALLAQYRVTDTDTDTDSPVPTSSQDWQAAATTLQNTTEQYRQHTATSEWSLQQPPASAAGMSLHPQHQADDDIDMASSCNSRDNDSQLPSSQTSEVSPVFYEVGAVEFEELPSHVRGRCSLRDTNQLLRKLQEDHHKLQQKQLKLLLHNQSKSKSKSVSHAKKKQLGGGREYVSLHVLEAAGHRVSGQTGRSMLRVLQSLGLLECRNASSGGGRQQAVGEAVALSASLCQQIGVGGSCCL